MRLWERDLGEELFATVSSTKYTLEKITRSRKGMQEKVWGTWPSVHWCTAAPTTTSAGVQGLSTGSQRGQ